MLVAAAVCPCPPLLVPDVAVGAADELAGARTACADAVGLLAASRPDRLYVVGPAGEDAAGTFPAGSVGSFAGFGVDLSVRLGTGPVGERPLPTSLSVGAWLLERAHWADAPIEGLAVAERLDEARCGAVGRELAASADRVALLVMGDGSACRTLKAPGYLDERAAPFDAAAARALGAADLEALRALDENLAYELKAAGRAPWQVLAGAAEGAGLEGRLLYEEAPYGVGYIVAAWS
ncbi:class III extradiol dioxygenase subunit B-like domain-containing protein [Streptomyces sp. ISL-36]|uniref:class III extradiol dioxygenase subunit B-like domain-containing protein n=1 Tax=Streptomyces sp. ISL-36 TaxID=2819182 RepID=UPI001BE7AD51|nr:class III extradiol dioxygenase subunit B-like domain-containing protein [Streptomyces sp. ISL-36]MBT2440646.1 class III extradiol dioxygenase subunit B-like domain-containing protein [Streptomyces sp. ISL-36]